MTKLEKISLLLVRLSLGWLFFYSGITKILNPGWTSLKYLTGAKSLTGFYVWMSQPSILPIIDALNEYGQLLLGISLILGIAVRLSATLGTVLMFLYYLALPFPYPNPQSFIVDQHIIYAAILLYLGVMRAGKTYGLEVLCSKLPICEKFPKLRKLLG
jgi:thiosulfate dehydrogenase [quinone] large subunit